MILNYIGVTMLFLFAFGLFYGAALSVGWRNVVFFCAITAALTVWILVAVLLVSY